MRRRQRGAVSLLLAAIAPVAFLVFAAAILLGAARGAAEHAQSGADAVAHAVAIAANSLADRDRLSIEAQAGRWCAEGDGAGASAPADDDLCWPLFAEAARVALADGVDVVTLVVGPDTRDMRGGPAPGRLAVLAVVAGHGPVAGNDALCSGDSATPLCRPRAASAAELVW